MEWRQRYSVGIREIDDQHKTLLDLIVGVELGLQAAVTWDETHESLGKLKEYANFHIAFEQALMRMYCFEGTERHMNTHKHFFLRLAKLESMEFKPSVNGQIVVHLVDWVKNHINIADREYATFILSGAPIVRSAPAAELELAA